jgi:hypothetical protein
MFKIKWLYTIIPIIENSCILLHIVNNFNVLHDFKLYKWIKYDWKEVVKDEDKKSFPRKKEELF